MRVSLLAAVLWASACAQPKFPAPSPDPIHLARLQQCEESEEKSRALAETALATEELSSDRAQFGRDLDSVVNSLWSAQYALGEIDARLEEIGLVEQAVTQLADQANQRRRESDAEVFNAVSIRLTEIRRQLRSHKEDAQRRLLSGEQQIAERRGPPSRLAGEIGAIQSGCDAGDTVSCYRLGSAYEHGIGIEKDHTWATTAYGTACGAGEAFACYRQGELLLSGALERKNAEGIAALKRGCDGGVGAACASLGRRVQHGEGVEQDASVAAALYHSGCIKGELGACVSAGLLYRDGGEGLARNGEKAVYALELACDEHLAAACGYLGEILLKGWGVSKDTARGRELREQACMWGDHSACLPE